MLLDEICRPTRRAEDCAEESDHGSAEGGEDSGEGGGFGGDRDTGEALQVGEDVPLGAGDRGDDREDDRDDDGPQPDSDSLLDSAEPCHSPGDVAAREIGDQQHEPYGDRADDTDGARVLGGSVCGFVRRGAVAETDGSPDRCDQGGQEHCGAHCREPAEEGGTKFEPAEFGLLAFVDVGAESVIGVNRDSCMGGSPRRTPARRAPDTRSSRCWSYGESRPTTCEQGGGCPPGDRGVLYATLHSKAPALALFEIRRAVYTVRLLGARVLMKSGAGVYNRIHRSV